MRNLFDESFDFFDRIVTVDVRDDAVAVIEARDQPRTCQSSGLLMASATSWSPSPWGVGVVGRFGFVSDSHDDFSRLVFRLPVLAQIQAREFLGHACFPAIVELAEQVTE